MNIGVKIVKSMLIGWEKMIPMILKFNWINI